eukprot:g8806.t1
MEGQNEGNHGDEVAEIGDGEAVLSGAPVPPAGWRGEAPGATAMPVTDVMALLQAMREEQLDTLKRIADGVQQLQSQVMVLGESVTASEGNTSMILSRLAALEVRMGANPVPMNPHDRMAMTPYHIQPQIQQGVRAGGRVGGGVGTGSVAGMPAFAASAQAGSSPPVAAKVPLPPPVAVAEPGRVPTWQGRAEPEPARTHFMRTASPHARPSAATSKPLPPARPAQAAARGVEAGGSNGGGRGEGDTEASKEAARKEAKRLAFMEDRARIQARISAKKGGGKEPAGAKPAPTSASPPSEKVGVVQTQPQFESLSARTPAAGLSTPFATPSDGGGLFSNSPSFLDDEDGSGKTRAGEKDEAAAWLEREKEQREQRERARREEEERVERQRAEAKRLKEEEQARKVREAEEARAREKTRREAEAKKQAKTRVLMSSLFDKGDGDDGNSLFGGLGGATLPVFTDESNDHNDFATSAGGTERATKIPVVLASSVSTLASPPPSSGGGLFGGIEEPTAAGHGGKQGPPFAEQFSSPMEEGPPTRMAPGVVVEAESSGLFDSLPPPSQASNNFTSSSIVATALSDRVADEMDDFLSTLETAGASAPIGGGTSTATGVRDSIFGDDEFAGGGNDDGIFSSLPKVETNRGAAGRDASAAQSGAGTSLFDRAEFSIDSGDDDGENVFVGGVGGAGGVKRGGGDKFGASFMSAMADADLSLSGDDGKPGGGKGADREGMVEVTL